MTKFEEEADKVAKQAGYESLSLLIGDCEEANKIYIHFKNWHSDEEFAKLRDDLDCASERVELLEGTVDDLKSQLQQQALPVVPEFVGDAVMKINLEHLFTGYTNGINEKAKNWLERHKGVKSLGYYVCQLRFQGFTVEKPQLFYLKHIDMSKEHNDVDWYLVNDGELDHDFEYKGLSPKQDRYKFTQKEIDSMNTGSYEQIEVVE